ncbi:unnamed protein product [Ectocarpus sp. 8 AP-2014]
MQVESGEAQQFQHNQLVLSRAPFCQHLQPLSVSLAEGGVVRLLPLFPALLLSSRRRHPYRSESHMAIASTAPTASTSLSAAAVAAVGQDLKLSCFHLSIFPTANRFAKTLCCLAREGAPGQLLLLCFYLWKGLDHDGWV